MKRLGKRASMTSDAWFVWAKKQRGDLGKSLQNYNEDFPFGAGVFPEGHLQYLGACLEIEQRNNEDDFDYAFRMFESLKSTVGSNGIDRAVETIKNSRGK